MASGGSLKQGFNLAGLKQSASAGKDAVLNAAHALGTTVCRAIVKPVKYTIGSFLALSVLQGVCTTVDNEINGPGVVDKADDLVLELPQTFVANIAFHISKNVHTIYARAAAPWADEQQAPGFDTPPFRDGPTLSPEDFKNIPVEPPEPDLPPPPMA